MRFTDHSAADGTPLVDAELRAARGDHVIILEDADCPPALTALCPWVQVQLVGSEYQVSFAAAADISLRFMSLRDPAACLFYFFSHQLSAEPLTRSWQLLLPGLGLATLEAANAKPIERRETLRRLGEYTDSFIRTRDPSGGGSGAGARWDRQKMGGKTANSLHMPHFCGDRDQIRSAVTRLRQHDLAHN